MRRKSVLPLDPAVMRDLQVSSAKETCLRGVNGRTTAASRMAPQPRPHRSPATKTKYTIHAKTVSLSSKSVGLHSRRCPPEVTSRVFHDTPLVYSLPARELPHAAAQGRHIPLAARLRLDVSGRTGGQVLIELILCNTICKQSPGLLWSGARRMTMWMVVDLPGEAGESAAFDGQRVEVALP